METQAMLFLLARLAEASGSRCVPSRGVHILFLSQRGNQGLTVSSVSGIGGCCSIWDCTGIFVDTRAYHHVLAVSFFLT